MTQLVSEYRALRASVLRLWAKSRDTLLETIAADDVTRFNEAVDQAIAESVDFFDRDLTQERIARSELDRAFAFNQARLEYASRLSRVGFWYCDLPFDVLEWDEQVKDHFFLEPTAKVTIEDFYERIHPEDREKTRSAIAASIESRSAYDIVYRTKHPSTGKVKWIRALGGADYASDGKPIHFDGITVDVTVQQLSENRLAESEARHRGVITNMGDAFTLFDSDFNIIEVNEAACRLVGMPRSELIGHDHWRRFPGTYNSELGRIYREVLAQGESQSIEQCYAFPDGRVAWFDVRAFKVGHGIAVLFRDVSEKREMIDALKNADQRKDEFLAMLAHELRNPLAPITTSAEILSCVPNPHPAVKSAAAVIGRQAKHMTRLIDDLLDVARITQGRIQLQKVTVDIADVVAQALEACESQVAAKQHRLNFSIIKTSPHLVQGDSARLVQCVSNLLSNAVKYTEPGGQIVVSVHSEGEVVVIDVADSGSGISPELLPRVFDLFVQSHRTLDRSQGGLGIGLAVVKRLVEMQGGTVNADSPGEGFGSRFSIRLPLVTAPPAATEQPQITSVAPRRIMIVDDNVDAADCLVALLEMQGHVLTVVYNPH
ncbi:MAG: ATP-binding protein, partial [Cellvibrio sp.]